MCAVNVICCIAIEKQNFSSLCLQLFLEFVDKVHGGTAVQVKTDNVPPFIRESSGCGSTKARRYSEDERPTAFIRHFLGSAPAFLSTMVADALSSSK